MSREAKREPGGQMEGLAGDLSDLSHLCENLDMNSGELKRWLEKQGCTFGTQEGSHLKVHHSGKSTVLPMHGKKELKKGTVNGIKRRLGLK